PPDAARERDLRKVLPKIFGFPKNSRGAGHLLNPGGWHDARWIEYAKAATTYKRWIKRGANQKSALREARLAGDPKVLLHLDDRTLLRHIKKISLKQFFIWLAGQPGYKSRISYSDAEYFSLSAKDTRIAKAHRDQRVPTLEQIRHVIQTMPASTEIERRDRALIALTILTGARDGAIASLKLKHIDIDQGRVDQDAREVKTKFSKSFATWFFPVGEDIRRIVVDWVTYLRQEKLWGLDDPLFPATKIVVGDSRHFEASGLDRKHWSSAGPIRAIFRDAFAAAGLSYFNPHSF